MSIGEHTHRRHRDGKFRLFATCVAVRGARNSAIYDLNRLRLLAFPTPYLDVLEELQRLSIEQVLQDHVAIGDVERVSDFVDYLLEAEVAFFVEDHDAFPALVQDWDCPAIIDNAIIDVDDPMHDFRACIGELDAVGCQFLQVRAYSTAFVLDHIRTIVAAATNTSLRSVEFLLCYTPDLECELTQLVRDHHIITRAVVHSAPLTVRKQLFAEHELLDGIGQKEIEFYARAVTSCEACGYITAKDLKAPTIDEFMEMSMFNGCLNRKISIDAQGNIKNCPSFSGEFGNITSMRLADVVKQAEFRRVWSIYKDNISVCKDCELRYACTDCRAYTVGDDPLGKPSRCGYDPYTGVWDENNRRDQMSPEFARGAFHE